MSAWPEAVWIVREMENNLNIKNEILTLMDRDTIMADAQQVNQNGVTRYEPIGQSGKTFSNESLWMVTANTSSDLARLKSRESFIAPASTNENGQKYPEGFEDATIYNDALWMITE